MNSVFNFVVGVIALLVFSVGFIVGGLPLWLEILGIVLGIVNLVVACWPKV